MTADLDLHREPHHNHTRAARPAAPGSSRRRPVLWAAGFATGLVGLAVGVGLGPRHWAKEGPTAPAALGLVLVVAGAGLSIWAARRLLASTRRRWWFLGVPAMLVALLLTLSTVGLATAGAFPPRPPLGSRTPADVGLAARTVAFPTDDGVELAGWYVPSRDAAAVVLLHGAGSTRTSVLDQAAVLAGHGFGVLLVDARGHGDSEGRGMDFGWYGERDVSAAVDFLAAQPGVDGERIGLLGLSMGAEEAIGAAGVDVRVAAVVAEGATNRVAEDKAFLDAYGVRGAVQQRIDQLTSAVTGLLTPAPRPQPLRSAVVEAASRPDPTPFLLITGGDVEEEGLAAARLRAAAPDQVSVWTVSGAGHTAGLRTAPDAWEQHVVDFLTRALLDPTADR